VGEPTTVELVIHAEGVLPSQLPALELVVPAGIRAYPDTPTSMKTLVKSGFRSEWKQSWALIPVRAGRFVLPELRLRWWDTQHERFREAVLPEQVYEAIPSAASQAQATRMDLTSAPASLLPTPVAGPFWKWLAFASFGLWGLTLGWWGWSKRRKESPEEPETEASTANLRKASRKLLSACKANDDTKTRSILLEWERLRHPQEYLQNLEDVVRLDPVLQKPVDELLQVCYGTSPQAWEGASLRSAIEQLAKVPNPTNVKPPKPMLEPLVPS
jgi:hypothetical protein